MGGGDSGCGSVFLGVTSNITFPKQNSIRPLGSCCSVWGMSLVCVCVCHMYIHSSVGECYVNRYICMCLMGPWGTVGVAVMVHY